MNEAFEALAKNTMAMKKTTPTDRLHNYSIVLYTNNKKEQNEKENCPC